jgi:hypothetical protein
MADVGTVRDERETRGLVDIVRALMGDAQELARGEIALARAEIDQKIERAMMALIWTMGGMLLGFAALVIILMAGVDALTPVLPVWAGSLLIGVIVALVGLLIARIGIRMLSLDKLAPKRTAHNLQADAQVVREHT